MVGRALLDSIGGDNGQQKVWIGHHRGSNLPSTRCFWLPGLAEEPSDPSTLRSADQIVAGLKGQLPGFGGSYVDADPATGEIKALNIRLVDPSKAAAIRAADEIRSLYKLAVPDDRIVIQKADYSFAQLKNWNDALRPVLNLPGVTFLDIQERTNRLAVGFEDPSNIGTALSDLLSELGIPSEAVEIRQSDRFVNMLRDRKRPLHGGTKIQYQTGIAGLGTGTCTMGFVATREQGPTNGFVTNSHCSRTEGAVDNGRYWQANRPLLSTDQVGTETVDPAYTVIAGCPPGSPPNRCRRSDSNFVGGFTAGARGALPRPAEGSFNWDGTSTFRIAEVGLGIEGMPVTKVGQTTGRTTGTLDQTCVDLPKAGGLFLLCQNIATGAAGSVAGGDSGSPVFRITNTPAANDVTLVGILWAGLQNGTQFAYSGFFETEAELGDLTVCAAGFVC